MMPSGKYGSDGMPMAVWEDYVAGTDPTDENSRFIAKVEIIDGVPKVTWEPALNGKDSDGACIKTGVRTYRMMGVKNLEEEWSEVPAGRESDYNFFKVSVEMP